MSLNSSNRQQTLDIMFCRGPIPFGPIAKSSGEKFVLSPPKILRKKFSTSRGLLLRSPSGDT